MVANNHSETATIDPELKATKRRLRNWHRWQVSLGSAGTGFAGRAAFYKVPGKGVELVHDPIDGELVESALTIFIRSWGRGQYRKVKNHVISYMPLAELARRAGLSEHLYKTEIYGLLDKVKYCIEYVERNQTQTD